MKSERREREFRSSFGKLFWKVCQCDNILSGMIFHKNPIVQRFYRFYKLAKVEVNSKELFFCISCNI